METLVRYGVESELVPGQDHQGLDLFAKRFISNNVDVQRRAIIMLKGNQSADGCDVNVGVPIYAWR